MRRPQFTIRALFIFMLAVACFFGGIRFEREMRRRADAAAAALAAKNAKRVIGSAALTFPGAVVRGNWPVKVEVVR